jgi:RNA polymerase sigma factor (sigma-70 family)
MSEASERSAEQPARIDEIATQWSLLRLAHQSSIRVAGPARNVLVLRYSRAIRGYVGAMVKDVEDADELAQEVVVRLLQGNFARANPERGRFRDMLKVAVRNVVLTYWTQKRRRAKVDVDVTQLPGVGEERQIEEEWTAAWQRSVLDMTWAAMEDYACAHPQSMSWMLLRLRADHPEDDLTQLAARFAQQTGKSLRPAALRQQLRRARLRFAQLLVEEVAKSLDDPNPERVEEELNLQSWILILPAAMDISGSRALRKAMRRIAPTRPARFAAWLWTQTGQKIRGSSQLSIQASKRPIPLQRSLRKRAPSLTCQRDSPLVPSFRTTRAARCPASATGSVVPWRKRNLSVFLISPATRSLGNWVKAEWGSSTRPISSA